jgi:hypothetical protein
MPPSQPVRRTRYSEADEAEEYISARRRERARRAIAASGLDVLSADAAFTWETPSDSPSHRRTDAHLDDWGDRVAAPRASVRQPVPADTFFDREARGDGRRTIVITGRGAERYPAPRRSYSSSLRRHERAGFRPDRLAMWAVVLCLALLLGAVATSHAAVLVAHAAALGGS